MSRRSRSDRRRGPSGPVQPRAPHAWIAALVIVCAGAAAYGNSLRGPFIFDDYPSIETNTTIRHLWALADVLVTTRETPAMLAGRPVANLSFAVNYAINGGSVVGYHVVNVLIHVLAGLVLFGVVRRATVRLPALRAAEGKPDTTRSGTESVPETTTVSIGLALVCALIWIAHPLNTEAVDYLTQRTESLAGLFWLLTLYAAARAWEPGRSRTWQIAAVAACACGVATKESVVTAPLAVVLFDRAFVCRSFREAMERRGRLYFALAGCWLLSAVLVWQAPFFRHDAFYSPGGFGARVSRWTYLLNQPPLIVRYLQLSVVPRALVLDYGAPANLSFADVWPSALLVLALVALTIGALIRAPRIGFWGAWFFLTLAPASSLVPIPTEVGAERRMYLPLAAVIVLVMLGARAGLQYLARVVNGEGDGRDGWVGVAAVTIVVSGLVVATRQRNVEYQSAVSIWQSVIDRRPNPRAHANFAAVLGEAGRVEEALAQLRLAAPDFVDAQRLLGLELLVRGEYQEAIAHLSEFARRAPDDPDIVQVREGLAAAYDRVGHPDLARRERDAARAIGASGKH